jgi:oxygen-dependent protoporphyrinogen oxidase
MKSVAVIGGGITGLTAAFRLSRLGVPVTLYEASGRVGGVIRSVRYDAFLAECGPNSILETSPKIASLVHDLDLESRRTYSDPAAEKRYLVRDGRPVAMPSSLGGFVRTPLFSPRAKLRLLREPFVSRAPVDAEESIAQFVTRRLGDEFLDHAIDALVAGVYAGEPSRLSVKEAFPRLHNLEQRYGSLILGQILGASERKRRAEVSKQSAKKFSFDDGLQVLTDTLRTALGNCVQLDSPVEWLAPTASGWRLLAGGQIRDHGAVLYSGTAGGLARLRIADERMPAFAPLAEVRHPAVASVVLGFRRQDVAHPLDGFGMLIPRVEQCNTLGTLFSSSLFPRRAPSGWVTLTTYLGGERNPELALSDPATLVELTMADHRRLLGVTGRPILEHHCVYPTAIPQYDLGFGRLRQLMSQAEDAAPGFFLAGHYRNGVSLGDSIVAGHDAADRIAHHLTSTGDNWASDGVQTATRAAA